MKSYASYHDLADKRVAITGGGTGIGAEMVTAFASQGARVFFPDIAEEAPRAFEQSLSDATHPPVLPSLSLYLSAKAAIEGMTRGLARDYFVDAGWFGA